MEKVGKVSDEIYVLMQDIVHLSQNNIIDSFGNYFRVAIEINDLVYVPTKDNLKKALMELKFLHADWINSKVGNYDFIYFIDLITFSDNSLQFYLSNYILKQLKTINFSLSSYIDKYTE